MKVLAFAASSSSKSINKALSNIAAQMTVAKANQSKADELRAVPRELKGQAHYELLDLNDYELPLYSLDRENELGHPSLAKDFLAKIAASDVLIISFAEHNGLYSAAYKNLFDWCSRITRDIYQHKAMLLLSTSPGARGGASVLEFATNHTPRFAGDVRASVAVPSFHDNVDIEKQKIINAKMYTKIEQAIDLLLA